MQIDLDWTEDSRDPLQLYAPIDRTLPVQRDDVGTILEALDNLGYYDAEASGIPAREQRDVHDAIERFQADHGLERDGVMQPNGPTLFKLNQIFEKRREEKFWRERAADAAQRQAEGRPVPTVMTGLSNAVVGPHPLADASADAGDRIINAQAGLNPRAPQRPVPGAPQPQQAPAVRPRQQAPGGRPQQEPDPSPDAADGPPWPVPEGRGVAERARFWRYLQTRDDLSREERIIYQVIYDWEGGRQYDRGDRSAFAGVRQSPLDSLAGYDPRNPHLGYADLEERVPRGRGYRPRSIGPGLSDADIVRVYRGLLQDTILPGSTYRYPDDPDVNRGRRYAEDGPRGIAAIVALDPQIALIVADTLLRWGPAGLRDIQEAVRDVMGRPGVQDAIRATLAARRSDEYPAPTVTMPEARGAFGTQTYGAIQDLVDPTVTRRLNNPPRRADRPDPPRDLRQELRDEILNRYGRTHQRGAPLLRGDEQRRAWLRSFQFPGR